MVERMADMPAGTLGFRVAGEVEREDYERVPVLSCAPRSKAVAGCARCN